jgi:homoserine/homoserine lactone efflux protein
VDDSFFLAFVGISTAVIVIPGPSVLLILSNSLQFGVRGGLVTALGISAAMAIQLAVAVAGVTSLIVLLSDWVAVIRWIGIAYLGYLGIVRLRQRDAGLDDAGVRRGGSGLAEGFFVSLTNPTTMTFFVAFFPQFLDESRSPASQFLTMSITFWVLAAGFDVAYAILGARLGKTLRESRWFRLRHRLSGGIILAAAVGLALAR